MAETNTTTQQGVVLQVPTTLKSLVEALIFGAREPLSTRQIQVLYEEQGVEGSEQRKISFEEISVLVEELNTEYASSDRPFRIIQIAGGYQFATQPAYAEWLGKLYKEQTRRKLSQSSVETLAIIAYKQPITKPELELIRGVNCDYVIKTLMEKDLATIVGRAPTVGRPLLYGTSKEFLKHFGLNDLNDLPRPREIQEILGESQFETERRMLEAQQGLDEMKKEEDFKSRLPHIPKRKAGLDDDVKILPKKRTREIKMRPTDDAGIPTLEPSNEEQPVRDAVETVSAPLADAQDMAIPVTLSADDQSVRMPANDLVTENPPFETEAATIESAMSLEQSKYLGLSQKGLEEESSDTEILEHGESEPEIEAAPQAPPVASDMSDQEAPQVPVEPSPSIEAESVLETVAEIPEPSEILSIEEGLTQEPEPAEPGLSEESTRVITPQPVSPSVEEHAEIVGHVESEESHSGETDPHSRSQSMTRWKTWKEKIQGFIKKLFG
jgi:segregation and condensation protein B